MTTTLTLGSYLIDIVQMSEFKEYYYNNLNYFSSTSVNAYLKSVDIPPRFFKEQPLETQDELIDNRDTFVREHKKYFGKVIVVARNQVDNNILNACRMDEQEAIKSYERLKTIDQVSGKFEHRSFNKDAYTTFVVSGDIKKDVDNQVLVVDFPITLNKPVVIHRAFYTLPDDTFVTPVEHIHYLTSDEIDFDLDYKDIKAAIEDKRGFLTETDLVTAEEEDILRDSDVVALALVEAGTISKSYKDKVEAYIETNRGEVLNTTKLESLVLDFDEELRSYKQVRALREVSGHEICRVLESDTFKEYVEELESALELEPEKVM